MESQNSSSTKIVGSTGDGLGVMPVKDKGAKKQ